MTDDREKLQATASKVFVAVLWLHVGLVVCVAYWLDNDWLVIGGAALGLAAIPTAACSRSAEAKSTRLIVCIALIGMVSLLLAACEGSTVQVDLHMYYFAMLAALTVYCDREVLLVGAGVTALHHLGLNFFASALVFPGGPHFGRVMLHAVIITLETAALIWMTERFASWSQAANRNLIKVVKAAEGARRAEAERQQRLIDEERAERERAVEAARADQALALVVDTLATGLGRLAHGDLTYRVDANFLPQYKRLERDFNIAAGCLEELLQGIAGNASGLRASADAISTAADDLSRRTERQAASLLETLSALAELSGTLHTTADGASTASTTVARTRQDAEHSGGIMRDAVTAMGEIERSSQQIGQIIGVIDEIAFQTNLLALNAGVEAARAGDAGRGFAVVASEVRALARRSADAAREIKSLIHASTQQVNAGAKLVGETGQTLGRIMAQVVEVSDVVNAIASSGQAQATGLAEVSTAIAEADHVAQQNASMVEQSISSARALVQNAEALAQLTGRFQFGARQAA